MAWIGKSHGIFRLHDSDQYCGSFLTIQDAAEILDLNTDELGSLPTRAIEGETFISELELHKAWGSGKIQSPQKPKEGNAKRSLDELIVRKLLQITLPGIPVECQIPFGRKRADLSFTHEGREVVPISVGGAVATLS
jgi:hypothetical protein